MNFLLSEGHTNARLYPIAYAFNEVKFAQSRVNEMLKTQTVLMFTAINQVWAGGPHLKETLEKLNGE